MSNRGVPRVLLGLERLEVERRILETARAATSAGAALNAWMPWLRRRVRRSASRQTASRSWCRSCGSLAAQPACWIYRSGAPDSEVMIRPYNLWPNVPEAVYTSTPPPSDVAAASVVPLHGQGGFLGILDRRELWASDVLYLNDSQEIGFGRRIIADSVARYAVGEFGEQINSVHGYGPHELGSNVFIVSFSGGCRRPFAVEGVRARRGLRHRI